MAINVAKAGFPLTVFDIRPEPVKELVEKGAAAGEDPADVAKKSEYVMMSLPDTGVVESVLFGEKGLVNCKLFHIPCGYRGN
jgi:3-hydroxyisobutyrate dehydrogenase-like beta-hydroxyacid dehydrogenase